MSTQTAGGKVFDFKTDYRPRYMKLESVIPMMLLPLELYWRDAKTIDFPLKNREGLIYPSITMMIFTTNYKVEQVDEKKFKIHVAEGYIPCPVCGKTIWSKIENNEIELERGIKRFRREVAFELALTSLSADLARKIKSHVIYTHKHPFEKVGEDTVLMIRNVGGEDVVMLTRISKYRCLDDKDDVVGVLGILEHVVRKHENIPQVKETLDFARYLESVTKEIFGLSKSEIPILGAFRNTFDYVIAETNREEQRVLAFKELTRNIKALLVERKGLVKLMYVTTIQRPLRGIYHYPLFRYVVPLLAYKTNPRGFREFMWSAKKALRRAGYSTGEFEKFENIVTGTLSYIPVEPRHAYTFDLNMLKRVVEKVREKSEDISAFIEFTEYGRK